MKIKLTTDLPIDPAHGMTAGKEFETKGETTRGFLVQAPSGQKVVVLHRECKILPGPHKRSQELESSLIAQETSDNGFRHAFRKLAEELEVEVSNLQDEVKKLRELYEANHG